MELGFGTWALDHLGKGCTGSKSQIPRVSVSRSSAFGQQVTVGLTGALANAPLMMIIGVTHYASPIEMTPMGAPRCLIFQSMDTLVPLVANASGQHSAQYKTHSSPLGCAAWYVQFFVHDKQANAFGWTTSNYARVLVGNK